MEAKLTTRQILDHFLKEAEQFDPEMFIPYEPVKKNEKVVGIVTDEFARRLHSAASFYRREGRRLQVDMEEAGIEALHSPEMQLLRSKHEVLMETFWYVTRVQFDLWGSNVGIRKDWQFVQTPDKDETIAGIVKASELPKFLRKLLEDLND